MRKYVRMITAFITTIAMMMASGVTVNAAGWKQDGKGWWFENTDGTYVSNTWKQVNGKWYAFDRQGYMRTGWFQENGKWYYLDNSGAMQTGWIKENEKWYYMGADGACFINTITPDGYMVDANGVWIDVRDNCDREESKKPSLEEVVEAYKAFIWYDFEYCMDDCDDNYLFIDLNNDGIPECIRRHYGKSNELGINVGILTYSEGANYYGNQNCNMLFEEICMPFYYVKGGNIFCNHWSNMTRFHKIADKGKFELVEQVENNDYVSQGEWDEVLKKEYNNYVNSFGFGEFTEISLKYEDTYRSIDAAYEAYLSEIGKNENTENDVLSESKVYEAIINMQSEYPEGMKWTNDNLYFWHGSIAGTRFWGGGCAGFAYLLSDAAFGDLPARKYTQYDPSTIKVGDIIRINNDSHSIIVLTVDEDGVTVAEGNVSNSIHWGGRWTHEQLMNADYIITRYQES